MKTNKIIFSIFGLFSAIVIISACSEKDLDQSNPNQLLPATFFTANIQVESAVNATYTNLQTIPLFTRAYFFMHDLMGGDAAGNPQLEADKVQYLNFSFGPNHGDMSGYWNVCYRGINKANFVIANEEKINEIPTLDETTRNRFYGEAKFMRALYYFLLVTRYGDIPLMTEIPIGTAGSPKSPKEDVYALIESDLQFAATSLFSKDDNNHQNGRATQEAARALLGKVYLYQDKFDLALDEFNEIYGMFSLEAEYYDNFKDETEFGPESIFEIQYDQTLGAGNLWGAGNAGAGANESTLRGQEYGFNDWFNTYPADDLLAEYEPNDPRYDDTFYIDGDLFEGNGKTVQTGVIPDPVPATDIYIPLQRNAAWRKYQNYYKRANENTDSSINFKFIRYADVLLMMAECENRKPGGVQSTAIGYINEVRDRADMPLLPTNLGASAVFDAIVHERRVELAGEQSRYNDLVRWGLAATELAGQGFQAGTHELWPIPQNEFSTNASLTPADQNPGYN